MGASLNSILSAAKTALQSQQIALQVASHNLANSTVEGYSRQRAELVALPPLTTPEGLLGTGVRVADITRARDSLFDNSFRRESSLLAGFSAQHDALRGVESVLGEPGELGLGATLDDFWNAWSDLANDPASRSARAAVVAAGQRLTDHFHRIDAALDRTSSESIQALNAGVDEVNRMLGEIAELNAGITAARAGGHSAPDLEDRRDLLLDQLSTYVPVDVTPRDGGAVGVAINGISVVEGTFAESLSVSTAGGVWSVETSSGASVDPASGLVWSALDILNDDFATLRSQLDEMAQGLVERVNALHVTGTNPLGATGVNFFDDFGDPTTVTARTLTLDAAILADPQAVAAGSADGSGAYQAGENDIGLGLAGLRESTSGGVLAGTSINDAYRDFVGAVGLSVASARDAEASHRALLAVARERRESVSGVASDEELIKVVQIQAAYSAAARIVNVVDEMYQTLLSI